MFLVLTYSSSLLGCIWPERIEGRDGESGILSYLYIALPVFTPLLHKQLLGTYAGEKSTFVGLNIPCFIIVTLCCVYNVSLDLKACCTAMLASCVIFFPIRLFLIGFSSGLYGVMKTTIVCLERQGFDHSVLMHTAG